MASKAKTGKGLNPFGRLKSRNVMVNGHRTSMRLEPAMWEALQDIALREDLSVHDLVSRIATQAAMLHEKIDNLTSAVRVFVALYYRRAATEEGHERAGHGAGNPFRGTPFDGGTPERKAVPDDDGVETNCLPQG
ncbi:ribbon-helix-helix domain-containing protein [Azospirillum sp. SYSU D00513]|uniref:ribbon-helix-helix domain-containing protein n=1 Tax=Azospirillum sp. SYSU D00513 TaxID=2812561 RepID=UPI001FFFEBDD|nr:ribbon-helix-helix domain-containing protein [Azospirillum sp. SYSU D00513]